MTTAIILGGTGMLAGVAEHLAADTWRVIAPSRWSGPGWKAHHDSVHWVRGHWQEPVQLAATVQQHLTSPAELLVAWVHMPHREAVLRAMEPLLAPGVPVVEVWGSATTDPTTMLQPPVLSDHPTHRVVLGYAREVSTVRWLAHTEISTGVLAAVKEALRGAQPRVHEVGQLRPWPPR